MKPLTRRKINSILKKADWSGYNNAPGRKDLLDFLFRASIVKLDIINDDSVSFKINKKLTPSLAFELGQMVGYSDEISKNFLSEMQNTIDNDQKEFCVWWN